MPCLPIRSCPCAACLCLTLPSAALRSAASRCRALLPFQYMPMPCDACRRYPVHSCPSVTLLYPPVLRGPTQCRPFLPLRSFAELAVAMRRGPILPLHCNAIHRLTPRPRPSLGFTMPSIPAIALRAAAMLCDRIRCGASRALPLLPLPCVACLYTAVPCFPFRTIACRHAPAHSCLSIPVPHRPFLCAALRDRTSIPANALLSRASHSCAMLCTPQKGYSAASRTCTTFGHSWCSNSRPSAKSSTSSAVASRNVP